MLRSVFAGRQMRVITLGWLLLGLMMGLGCVRFDRIGTNSFRSAPFAAMFTSRDPSEVIRDPNSTGDELTEAMHNLDEPLAEGGNEEEQEEVIQFLSQMAIQDERALCRLMAIDTLSRFKDPRVPDILIRAYHHAEPQATPSDASPRHYIKLANHETPMSMDPEGFVALDDNRFAPQTITRIRCKVLQALGKLRAEQALPMLTEVATRPIKIDQKRGNILAPVRSLSSQQQQDLRLAAVRALREYPAASPAAQPLVKLLRSDDVALRDHAHDGLQMMTGRDLPAEPHLWEMALGQPVPGKPSQTIPQHQEISTVGWNRD